MRIGWILVGNSTVPSARQIGLMTHDWLLANTNIKSEILNTLGLYNPILKMTQEQIMNTLYNKFDIVIFQKVCLGMSMTILTACKEKGIKTVYIIDDLIGEGLPMCRAADYVISGDASDYLADVVQSNCNKDAYLMPNPIETPKNFCKEDYAAKNGVQVLWFGTEGHILQAKAIAPICEKLGYYYDLVSSGPYATIPWTPNFTANIKNSDIIVMPYLGELPPYELAKGSNRGQQAMAIGLPIISSPLPSYIKLIRQGKTGFIAYQNDLADWEFYLRMLGKQALREKIGRAAREATINEFSMDSVGQLWEEYLRSL